MEVLDKKQRFLEERHNLAFLQRNYSNNFHQSGKRY